MGKDEAHDYRGFRIEPCDGPKGGAWRLMIRDISRREWVEQCNRPRFDMLREAREHIDMMHEEGERSGWRMEREAMEEFDRALYRLGSRDAALREAGNMHGFDPHEMSILLEKRERPGARPRRSKPTGCTPVLAGVQARTGPAPSAALRAGELVAGVHPAVPDSSRRPHHVESGQIGSSCAVARVRASRRAFLNALR